MIPRRTAPALALIVASGLLASCHDASGRATTEDGSVTPDPVRVSLISHRELAPPIEATGTLAAKEEITLAFKVGGIVERMLVDPGERVHEGDTLAVLDLREIDAAVARARSAAEKTARDLARARSLHEDSVVTLARLQDAETADAVARADLQTAQFNRRHALIIAPASGVILRRMAEPGELLGAGAAVLVLGSTARGMVLRVGLADRDVVRVRRGDSATVRFEAIADHAFAGTVSEIAAAADPLTGTYAVEIRLPEAANLATGFVGRAEIQPSDVERVTLVPIEALIEADDSVGIMYALSTDGTRAERRHVTIGFLAGDRVALTHGLEGVTRVITDGAAYLRDGQPVRVLP